MADSPYQRNLSKNSRGGTIYSFGIGEDLSFSQEMLDKFDCKVYAFDPTPKSIQYVQNHTLNHEPRFSFYPVGLSAADEVADFFLPTNKEYVSGSIQSRDELLATPIKVNMKRLSTITKELGHTHIDVLKMDIEGSEFSAIQDILDSGVDFDQLCIEEHSRFFDDGKKKLKTMVRSLRKHGYLLCCADSDNLLFCKKSLV